MPRICHYIPFAVVKQVLRQASTAPHPYRCVPVPGMRSAPAVLRDTVLFLVTSNRC